eukprot:g1110.t1
MSKKRKASSSAGEEGDKVQRLEQELKEVKEREGLLVMRLSMKESEIHQLQSCVQDLYKTQGRAEGFLRKTLLDPAVNLEVQLLKNQLKDANEKVKTYQQELEAVKFDPKSNTGRKLVAKCRTLLLENEELGKQVSEGTIQQLRVERDLQKAEVVRLRKDLEEALLFNEDMDEERQALSVQVFKLQKQLTLMKKRLEKAAAAGVAAGGDGAAKA